MLPQHIEQNKPNCLSVVQDVLCTELLLLNFGYLQVIPYQSDIAKSIKMEIYIFSVEDLRTRCDKVW